MAAQPSHAFFQMAHKQRDLSAVFSGEVFYASKYEKHLNSPTADSYRMRGFLDTFPHVREFDVLAIGAVGNKQQCNDC
jgi:hypothetical protein